MQGGVNLIELGKLVSQNSDVNRNLKNVMDGLCYYDSVEKASEYISDSLEDDCYSLFCEGMDIQLDKIADWKPGLCKIIRLGLWYSDLKKSFEVCQAFAEKGYSVSMQLTVITRYTDNQIIQILQHANKIKASYVYIVDTYGYMTADKFLHCYKLFSEYLDPDITIGLHPHNNMNLAVSNLLQILPVINRNVVVDSCCLGMGRGAGNAQTELLAYFLSEQYGGNYDLYNILEACEEVSMLCREPEWGYSVPRLIPAQFKTDFKYGEVLRDRYHFKYSEIYRIIENMPDEMRNRFTEDNLKTLLNI